MYIPAPQESTSQQCGSVGRDCKNQEHRKYKCVILLMGCGDSSAEFCYHSMQWLVLLPHRAFSSMFLIFAVTANMEAHVTLLLPSQNFCSISSSRNWLEQMCNDVVHRHTDKREHSGYHRSLKRTGCDRTCGQSSPSIHTNPVSLWGSCLIIIGQLSGCLNGCTIFFIVFLFTLFLRLFNVGDCHVIVWWQLPTADV